MEFCGLPFSRPIAANVIVEGTLSLSVGDYRLSPEQRMQMKMLAI
jgi:hypothetical protein